MLPFLRIEIHVKWEAIPKTYAINKSNVIEVPRILSLRCLDSLYRAKFGIYTFYTLIKN